MKALAQMSLLAAMLVLGMLVPAMAAPAAAPDGAAVFARCAACHTPTGAGVPGVFPPLGADFRAQAAKKAGRRYLALAVMKGLTGPLTVGGTTYRGVMPAQAGLDSAAIAAALNHVGTKIARTGPAFKPFTAAEVAGYGARAGALSGADVAKLHKDLGK